MKRLILLIVLLGVAACSPPAPTQPTAVETMPSATATPRPTTEPQTAVPTRPPTPDPLVSAERVTFELVGQQPFSGVRAFFVGSGVTYLGEGQTVSELYTAEPEDARILQRSEPLGAPIDVLILVGSTLFVGAGEDVLLMDPDDLTVEGRITLTHRTAHLLYQDGTLYAAGGGQVSLIEDEAVVDTVTAPTAAIAYAGGEVYVSDGAAVYVLGEDEPAFESDALTLRGYGDTLLAGLTAYDVGRRTPREIERFGPTRGEGFRATGVAAGGGWLYAPGFVQEVVQIPVFERLPVERLPAEEAITSASVQIAGNQVIVWEPTGLLIFQIFEEENAFELEGRYDIFDIHDLAIAGDTLIMADYGGNSVSRRDPGSEVATVSLPDLTVLDSYRPFPYDGAGRPNIIQVAVSGGRAYLVDIADIRVIGIEEPRFITYLSALLSTEYQTYNFWQFGNDPVDIAVEQNIIYTGTLVIDMKDVGAPLVRYETEGRSGAAADDGLLMTADYVQAAGGTLLRIYDIADVPVSGPLPLGEVYVPGNQVVTLAVDGDRGIVGTEQGAAVVSLPDGDIVALLPYGQTADLAVADGVAYAVSGPTLYAIDLEDGQVIGTYALPTEGGAVAAGGGYVAVVSGGLLLFEVR